MADAATLDRSATLLVDEQIGRTRYLTPEGFLYCEGVRIARVGPMLYLQSEAPEIEPDGNRMITVTRDATVLFHPDALASFEGKPVTNDHPPEFIGPATFRTYTVGTVLNPRRGEGVEADYLLADLLIKDQAAIDAVTAGKCEVSPGYHAPRVQVKPGLARQTSVIGNHVALVERGRGGPACAIQDEQPGAAIEEGNSNMTTKKRSVWDRLATAFKANDEAAFKEELEAAKDEAGSDEPQKIVIEVKQPDAMAAAAEDEGEGETGGSDTDKRLTALEAAVTKLAEFVAKMQAAEEAEAAADEDAEKKDDDKKDDSTADAAPTAEVFADTVARAEILAPGIQLPTMDAKAAPKTASKALNDLRVRALKSAFADSKRKAHVATVLGSQPATFDKMPAINVAAIFNAASELAKTANASSASRPVFPQGRMTTAKYAEQIAARHKRA